MTVKNKNYNEVAHNITNIFCIFEVPFKLQSDKGREFVKHIINNFVLM